MYVGIYWQRYGWVAPGMDVSGLEDEYRLARGKPHLIYVKHPSNPEPELARLLGHIRDAGDSSYKSFSSADELARLVAADLAVMLSEAFQTVTRPGEVETASTFAPLPADPSSFVGRAAEVEELRATLSDQQTRVVTLTGPGGIGKTRLALHVARQLSSDRGVAFVPLANVQTAAQLPAAVAAAAGLREVSNETPLDEISDRLRDQPVLIVLVNMEHLVSASALIGELLERTPSLRLPVTSREALRIRGEIEFPVPPMTTSEPAASLETVPAADAV